jgi:hypothetical protein
MKTPRMAGARLRFMARLLRSFLGPLIRRLGARMVSGPLRRARLQDAPPSVTPPLDGEP